MQKTKQMMQKRCKNTKPARSQKIEQTMKKNDAIQRPRAWFPFGPNNNFFFTESVVGEPPSTTNRIASRGSPHDPTMQSRPCDPTALACTQPAHPVPSRRPDLRLVTWREGMIGRLTLGARVRRNPTGFRGVLSWSTGFQRL